MEHIAAVCAQAAPPRQPHPLTRSLRPLRPVPLCSKFLARNTPLERLLKDHRESHAPAGSEGSSALDVDDDRDSCDIDDSADMDDDADAATQACADSAFTSKKGAAPAVSTPAAQTAHTAAKAAAPPTTAMSAGRGLRAAFAPSSTAAAASVRRASACEASPAAAGRASPTSSTHSEQCGVNNSAGHADTLNPALTSYCQVSSSN